MRKLVVALLAVAMLATLSFAQVKGGDIYGQIVLADGSKVPGVLITLTSDVSGKKTTISTDQGNFRFLELAPGLYELRFELDGFKTIIRKDIQVSLGKSVTISNIVMETSTLKEEVVVTEKAGTIDMRRTNVGVNVGKDIVDSIPTARNPWTVLSALPGVMVDRVDIGGADSGQQSNFLAGGGDKDDTTWTIDGANVTDPSAIGAAPAYLNVNAYSDLQVTMGANDITAQTGGVQLNFVTKRSGNKTSGDFHLYVEDKAWEMKQTPTDYMDEAGLVIPGVNRLYQYGINLGGAVIKDKVWWFGSWAVQDIHKRTEANLEDSTWLVSAYGKLNFQFGNTTGDFHVSYDAKKKWGRSQLSPSQQDQGSLWNQDGPGYVVYGGLSHTFGELLLNVKAVYTDGGFSLTPNGSEYNAATGFQEGTEAKNIDGWSRLEGSTTNYFTNRNTVDLAADGNYFLEGALGGDHEIKFGVDYFSADTTSQSLVPNQRVAYIYRDGTGANNYLQIYPNYKLDVNFYRVSAYLQDTITFGKLTAAIGLRYDLEQGGVNALTQPYFTWYEPGSSHDGERMFADTIAALNIAKYKVPANWSLFSPRLAFTYDITGNGKNVIKLSAGRYMSQSGNRMAAALIPLRYGYAAWNDANLDEIPQYDEVGDLFWDDLFYQVDPETGMNRVIFDKDYNTPYLDELTLTFEKVLLDDLAVSLTGFYKKRHNLAYDVNSRGEVASNTKGYFLDSNGAVTIETSANWERVDDITVGGTTVPAYQQIETPEGLYFYNYKDSYYRYLGLQFVLNKKLSNKWMGTVSFTYQDWKRHLAQSDLLELNNYDFFNEGQVAPSTTGSGLRDVWMNSRWMVKVTGMYQLPLGFNLTTFFQAKEGNPQPLRRRVNLSMGSRYFYRAGYKSGDERLPTMWLLNLGLEKTLKVSDTVTATLVVDWYNATNNQIELKRNIGIGAAAVTSVQPTMWTNAGLFQFGVRVNF